MSAEPGDLGPQATAHPRAGFPVDLYASFERVSGGLLHILQGLLWLAQALLARGVQVKSDWSLLFFLPGYLIYYPARRCLRCRLYRPYGHVEREQELEILRFQASWGPGWLSFLALTMYLARQPTPWRISLPAAVVWPLVLWVPLLLWGRLSVDLHHYIPLYVLMVNASCSLPYLWRWPLIAAMPVGYVVVRLAQHIWFNRALSAYRRSAPSGDARPPDPPPDPALPQPGSPQEAGA
jgi:hypothetical protein